MRGGPECAISGRWWEGKQAPLARAKQAASDFNARRMWIVVVGRIRRLLPRVRHESSMCVSIGAGSAGKGSCSRARQADLYMLSTGVKRRDPQCECLAEERTFVFHSQCS